MPPREGRQVWRAATVRNSTKALNVKRWDGKRRVASDWDALHNDPELWFPMGNCIVHLSSRGQSKRGPAFRIPLDHLDRFQPDGLHRSHLQAIVQEEIPGQGLQQRSPIYELYIPAPNDASREDAFQWHITTRNFFAFVFRRPLVGSYLGKSLIQLHERIRLFCNLADSQGAVRCYAEEMRYLDFSSNPDLALAQLCYAEHFQLKGTWVDAFAHCVGMNDSLCLSSEFEPVSRVTKALITRSYLEMELHIGRIRKALCGFLEEELSSQYLGLTDEARAHLDLFRTFLHTFYVRRHGYWPPPSKPSFPKSLYKSMYIDFRCLYDYLVDLESTTSFQNQKPVSGGICVLQNTQAFDKRQKFIPLLHPLPLLPTVPRTKSNNHSQKTFMVLGIGSKQARNEWIASTKVNLATASNRQNLSVVDSLLVREYMRFEQDHCANLDSKLTLSDARKVRWLMIYGILQVLVSVLRAPKEVRDTEKAKYPLCCMVADIAPWEAGIKALTAPGVSSNDPVTPQRVAMGLAAASTEEEMSRPSTPSPSIHPDCEHSDYLQHKYIDVPSRPSSIPPELQAFVPRRLSIPSRKSSLLGLKNLSPFGSRRGSTSTIPGIEASPNLPSPKPTSPFCEILVSGYGNGLQETVGSRSEFTLHPPAPKQPALSSDQQVNHEAWRAAVEAATRNAKTKRRTRSVELLQACTTTPMQHMRCRTPLLEETQLELEPRLVPLPLCPKFKLPPSHAACNVDHQSTPDYPSLDDDPGDDDDRSCSHTSTSPPSTPSWSAASRSSSSSSKTSVSKTATRAVQVIPTRPPTIMLPIRLRCPSNAAPLPVPAFLSKFGPEIAAEPMH